MVLSGFVSDMRRSGNGLPLLVCVIGALRCAFSVNAPMLIGFRFLLGILVGTASFVTPLYISEVSPVKVRGGLVSFNGSPSPAASSSLLPGAALAIGMLSVPPHPALAHGTTTHRRGAPCAATAARLRPRRRHRPRDGHTTQASKKEDSTRVRDLLSPKIRPLMIIGLGLACASCFVGINTVIYDAPTIVADTGLTNSSSITQTVFVGITSVVFTVVAELLLDRVGRRKLLLTGTVRMLLSLILLDIYFSSSMLQNQAGYLALLALLIYIASFAIGLGPVFWLMISEIYPVEIRSKATSVSTLGNWAANFLVAATFLSLGNIITRQGTFFLYAAIAVLAFVFDLAKVPETKDRKLEQIQDDLSISDDQPTKETA